MEFDRDYFNAYVAGFFDGEGNIQLIQRGARRDRSPSGWIQYSVQITNTNRGILEEIQSAFGGRLRTVREATVKTQTIYRLSLMARREIEYFLFSVMPYLRLKRPQAELLVQYFRKRRYGRNSIAESRLCHLMKEANACSRKRAA